MPLGIQVIMDKNSQPYKSIKKIELGYKSILHKSFGLFFNRNRVLGKLDPKKIKTILVFRNDKIGDMVVTYPMLQYLKMINPEFRIILFCSQYNKSLAINCPYADEIIIEEKNFLKELKYLFRKRQVDLMINTLHRKISNNLIRTLLICGNSTIRAMRNDSHKMIDYYNLFPIESIKSTNMTQKLLTLVYDIFETDITIDKVPIDFPISNEAAQKVNVFLRNIGFDTYIVINLSAGQSKNEWTEIGYKLFIERILSETNKNIILIFTPAKESFASKIVDEINNKRLIAYSSTNNLFEIAGLIKAAELVLTPDTAIVHFASLLSVPLLALYNGDNNNLSEWSPFNTKYEIVQADFGKNVESIGLEQVWTGFTNLISNK